MKKKMIAIFTVLVFTFVLTGNMYGGCWDEYEDCLVEGYSKISSTGWKRKVAIEIVNISCWGGFVACQAN
jgi:hypothetical protein